MSLYDWTMTLLTVAGCAGVIWFSIKLSRCRVEVKRRAYIHEQLEVGKDSNKLRHIGKDE
jgi:hypothetical protein